MSKYEKIFNKWMDLKSPDQQEQCYKKILREQAGKFCEMCEQIYSKPGPDQFYTCGWCQKHVCGICEPNGLCDGCGDIYCKDCSYHVGNVQFEDGTKECLCSSCERIPRNY